jgi:hypothetical protein
MIFEWDDAKARTNLVKHGISFEAAKRVWDDPLFEIYHHVENGEDRYLAIGMVLGATILAVAHVYRGDDEEQVVRIISARRATPHERKTYEQ